MMSMSEPQVKAPRATGPESRAYTPFPLAPHVTKTIRFREEFLALVKQHASLMAEEERRAVSQSEIIDMALTQFFAATSRVNSNQIDMFEDSTQPA
ncbi:Uncharacterised protein [Bordetella pseudohinzii]|nr:Uncharacterised protein [Bordetella pseudohinzii]